MTHRTSLERLIWALLLAATSSARAGDEDVSQSAGTAVSRGQQTLLEEAQADAKAGRYAEATQRLQEIWNADPALISSPSGYEQAATAAERVYQSLPAQEKSRYEELHGPLARIKLQRALRVGDLESIQSIAERYRWTKAGEQALRYLALRHFDHGAFLQSATAWESLSRRGGISSLSPSDVRRWIHALVQLGLRDKAKFVADRFQQPLTKEDSLAAVALPAMTPAWQHSLRLSGSAEQSLQAMHKELGRRGFRVDSAFSPLVWGDLVIARNLHSVWAFNSSTGKVRWSKPMKAGILELAENAGMMSKPGLQQMISRQLAAAAFADTAIGNMTHDETRLYLLHRASSRSLIKRTGSSAGSVASGTICRLVALEAKTGEEIWRFPQDRRRGQGAGRSASSESPTVFFGPPKPLGRSVYAIGQNGRDIRLYAISASTGELEWSLSLLTAPLPIEKDQQRRRMHCLISVSAGGMLLCPTGAGAVVAVDPLLRNCRWILRYKRDNLPVRPAGTWPNPGEDPQVGLDLWWQGWRDARIVTTEDVAVVASPESDRLIAVSIRTGKRLWTKPRGDGFLTYAGDAKHVIVVGSQGIHVVDAESGETDWSAACQPSGRGEVIDSAAGRSYVTPVRTGGFLQLNLDTRAIARTYPLDGATVGNLVAMSDSFFSQSTDEIRRWKPCSADEMTERDPFERARLLHEAGRFRDSIRVLEPLLNSSETEPKAKKQLFETLLSELSARPRRTDEIVRELKPLLTSAKRRIRGWRAIAEAYQLEGRSIPALGAWSNVLKENSLESTVIDHDSQWEVALPRYIQGRLQDLLTSADPDTRQALASVLDRHRAQVLAQRDPFSASRFARQFDQLRWGRELLLDPEIRTGLGQSALEKQLQLWSFTEAANNKGLQADALRRLAEDRAEGFAFAEAALIYHRLRRDFPEVSFSDGQTVRDVIERIPRDSLLGQAIFPKEKPRTNRRPRVQEAPARKSAGSWRSVSVDPRPGSLCERLDVWLDAKRRRLRFVDDRHPGSWELALTGESPAIANDELLTRGWGIGSLLVLQRGTDLMGIAPLNDHGEPRPRMLWRLRMFETAGLGEQYPEVLSFRQVQPPAGFGILKAELFDHFHQAIAEVGPVSAGQLIYQSGGRLSAIAPAGGQLLWRRSGLPIEAQVLGDGQHVVLKSPQSSQVTLIRAMDGKLLGQRQILSDLRLLAWYGVRVLCERDHSGGQELSLWNAATDRFVWQQEFAAETLPFQVDADQFGTITPEGEVTIFETNTGRKVSSNTIAARKPSRVYAITDAERLYLAVEHLPRAPRESGRTTILDDRSVSHPLVPGSLHAFDWRTGRALWHSDWNHWAIPLNQPRIGPVLILHHREKTPGHKPTAVLQILDKQTGRQVQRLESPTLRDAPVWSMSQRNVFEIQAYQNSLRLQYD